MSLLGCREVKQPKVSQENPFLIWQTGNTETPCKLWCFLHNRKMTVHVVHHLLYWNKMRKWYLLYVCSVSVYKTINLILWLIHSDTTLSQVCLHSNLIKWWLIGDYFFRKTLWIALAAELTLLKPLVINMTDLDALERVKHCEWSRVWHRYYVEE